MIKKLLLLSVTSLFALNAQADLLGATAGIAAWQYDISGSARYQSNSSNDDIDLNDDLGYDDDSSVFFYASFEHFIPLVPNVKVVRTSVSSDANGVLSQSYSYGGLTYNLGEAVSSEISLDQTDFTFYYSPLDTVANIDFGLTIRHLDASAKITGAVTGTEEADVSAWIPLPYVGVGIDLPFTGLSVAAEGSGIKFQGNHYYDFTAQVRYDTPWFTGINLGYRSIVFKLDDVDDTFADIEFSGPFIGIYAAF